ncbi:RNAse III [Pyrenophora tritici-repentis]|nr:RNAse III [Pyrenophora tritici-repentis]
MTDPMLDSVSPDDITETAQQKLGYTFMNKANAFRAIKHAKNPFGPGFVNDSLAVIGSVKMANVLCNWWSLRPDFYGQESAAEWTMVTHDKLGLTALANLARSLSLDSCLRNPKMFTFADLRFPLMVEKTLANMTKAIMGAVFLDGGEEAFVGVMKKLQFDQHESGYLGALYPTSVIKTEEPYIT